MCDIDPLVVEIGPVPLVAKLSVFMVNLTNAAFTQRQVFKVAPEANSRIANWHIGEVPTSWFESAVRSHSPRKPRGR